LAKAENQLIYQVPLAEANGNKQVVIAKCEGVILSFVEG
jgi:hypothetical protein